MKVLLINPNATLVERSRKLQTFLTPILPLGIASIGSTLEKAGHEVEAVDQFANKMPGQELLAWIKKFSPDVIGFSCITPVMTNVKALSRSIRDFSRAKIVLGNIHPTIFTDEVLLDGTADIVVRGEGELSMLETVNALAQGSGLYGVEGISFLDGGKVVRNPDRAVIEDLDTLAYPAWHLFELDLYKYTPQALIHDELGMPIMGSRGCYHRCVFCAQDKVYKGVRFRKNAEIVKELEYMHERFNARYFGFLDSCFPFSQEEGIDFCRRLKSSGLHKKIRWCTETRVDMVNEELLSEMKEAGLHLLMLGLESGNQEVLNRIGKGTTLEQARKAMKAVKRLKIFTLGLFMLGLPGETRSSSEDTIRFAKEVDCDVTKFNLTIPYPGSRLFDSIYKGKEVPDPEKFNPWYDWAEDQGSLLYVPEGMEQRELLNLQRKAMFEFYCRPRVILRYLAHTRMGIRKLFYGGYVLLSRYCLYLKDRFFGKGRIKDGG